jgi:hypothetical protein
MRYKKAVIVKTRNHKDDHGSRKTAVIAIAESLAQLRPDFQ